MNPWGEPAVGPLQAGVTGAGASCCRFSVPSARGGTCPACLQLDLFARVGFLRLQCTGAGVAREPLGRAVFGAVRTPPGAGRTPNALRVRFDGLPRQRGRARKEIRGNA